MVIEHAFYKKASKVVKEATEKYFQTLGEVSKVELDRFEPPIQSIRRVVGSRFYDLTSGKEDLIRMRIYDGTSFDINSIKIDNENGRFDTMNEIALFATAIFDKFTQMYGNTIIGKDFEDVKFKVAVTSPTKGMICKELSIKDFSPLSVFDSNGNVIGILGFQEIMKLNTDLMEASKAAEKIKRTGVGIDNAARETLTQKINLLNTQLVQKYMEIVETFFNLIKLWGEVESVSEIYDVTFVFNIVIVDNNAEPKEGEEALDKIVEMDILNLHDIAHSHLITLKTKFD